MLDWMKHKPRSKLPCEIQITSDMQMITPLYGRKRRGTKEFLDESERGEWKSWLKTQHSKNENHGIQSHYLMANRWGNNGNSERLYFLVLQNHCRWWLQPWIKICLLLGRKAMTSLSSVQFSCSVVSDSLRPHELQHARPPCPSPTLGVHPNPSPLSLWCHPTILSSIVPFSSCPQSFPASESLQMSEFFASGGQNIGVAASASVPPMNAQDWSPLGWTSWISLKSKGLSRVFSNTTVQKHKFFGTQLSL